MNANVPSGNNIEKLRFLLKPDNLRNFCIMLEDMLEERKNLLYNKVEVEGNQVEGNTQNVTENT